MPIHPDDYSDSIEAYLTLRGGRSNVIYISLLTTVMIGLSALPLVRVPVSIRAAGMVRPETERHEITAPVSGFVERVGASDNDDVAAGAELVRLESRGSGDRIRVLDRQVDQARAEIRSLQMLLADAEAVDQSWLPGDRLAAEREQFLAEVGAVGRELRRAREELGRSLAMVERGLAPAHEAREQKRSLDRVQEDSTALAAGYRARWAADLQRLQADLERLEADVEAVGLERELAFIRAPLAGTLAEVTPISPGSYVAAGTALFVLSPSSMPVAEVYVPATDIGLIRPGVPVKILVDSFDHNVWGKLDGVVSSISADHVMMADQAIFVVEVTLAGTTLTTPSGAVARIIKGMSLQAHFEIAERSLWQLLRDDVGDWLNPAQG